MNRYGLPFVVYDKDTFLAEVFHIVGNSLGTNSEVCEHAHLSDAWQSHELPTTRVLEKMEGKSVCAV